MAGKNWQAGGKNPVPAKVVACLVAAVAPCGLAWSAPLSGGFAPASYIGELDPNRLWELLIGGIVVASFVGSVGLWALSALRKSQRAKLRRNAFISSALNNLNQGVMMADAQGRIVFCNDRFLEIYEFTRADIATCRTGRDLVELRHSRGMLNVTVEEFTALARRPEGAVTELPRRKIRPLEDIPPAERWDDRNA